MNTSDLERLIQNLIRIGTIYAVDESARKIKVTSGKLVTQWLDWPAEEGRNYKRWRPLRLGTQVILASPGGDLSQAMIIGMLYSDALPPPSTDPDIDLIQFDDGSFIQHNHGTKHLSFHSAGDLTITCVGDMSLTADGNIKIEATRVDIN
ncbi:phage baseplate assembly protein V [Gammaproteobacteria bacterium AS21]